MNPSILLYSLSENPEPLQYLPPSSPLLPPEKPNSSLFPLQTHLPIFPPSLSPAGLSGGEERRGKLETELKRERENSQVPLSTLPTLPLTLQTRALHVGPPLVRNRHSSEGSAMPQDKMAARANRKRKASSEHWLFSFPACPGWALAFPSQQRHF